MDRCSWSKDYNGVIVPCRLPADHGERLGIHLHEPACTTCTGEIPDVFPEPGMRCITHGVREPGA